MQSILKKIYIGVIACLLVLITTIATTFAWVGMLTYSSTDDFSLNLKVVDTDKDYFLVISGDDANYSEMVPLVTIQRQILSNMKFENDLIDPIKSPDEAIELRFNNLTLSPATTTIKNNSIQPFTKFKDITKNTDIEETFRNYYKFDLYLSVESKEGIQSTTEINTDIFLADIQKSLEGSLGDSTLVNGNPFKSLPSDDLYNALKGVPDTSSFTVNSANASRFALELYQPIDINSTYDETQKPIKTYIYQGGKNIPSYIDGIYDLGGNLPEDYNLALKELNKMYNRSLEVPNYIINRGDLELTEENRSIWNAPSIIEDTNYLGVHNGIRTKMKITVYFWFEGWDADCLRNIEKKNVTLNLSFSNTLD